MKMTILILPLAKRTFCFRCSALKVRHDFIKEYISINTIKKYIIETAIIRKCDITFNSLTCIIL